MTTTSESIFLRRGEINELMRIEAMARQMMKGYGCFTQWGILETVYYHCEAICAVDRRPAKVPTMDVRADRRACWTQLIQAETWSPQISSRSSLPTTACNWTLQCQSLSSSSQHDVGLLPFIVFLPLSLICTSFFLNIYLCWRSLSTPLCIHTKVVTWHSWHRKLRCYRPR